MERQLHGWFRYALILGIQTQNPTTESTLPATALFRAHTKPRSAFSLKLKVLVDRLQYCYNYGLLLLVIAVYLIGLYWRRGIANTVLTWLAANILFTAQALTNVLIIAESLWRRQEHEAFLLLLQRIAFAFKLRLRQPIDQQQLVFTLRRHLCYLLATSMIGLLLFLLTTLWMQYFGYFWYGLWFIITMRVRIIQLLIYLRVLRHYMHCLVKQLNRIVAYHKAPDSQILDYDSAKLLSLEYMMAINEVYMLLCEAFQLMNAFAGWSLCGIITCYMLDISCNLYWVRLSLEGFTRRRYYYIASIWTLWPMIAIVWHICRLSEECKQLDRALANLLSKIFISSTSRSMRPYRLFLQQFIMQLQLQPINVSAKEFFNLDMPLLMSISIAITTYFVILRQFANF